MPAMLRLGVRGPDVIRSQNILNSSLSPSPNLRPDGILGPRTAAAVRDFQGFVNLTVDGVVGPKSWAALEPGSVDVAHSAQVPSINLSNAPWMAIARNELGQSEIRGAQHNPQIIQYHGTTTYRARTDEVPWYDTNSLLRSRRRRPKNPSRDLVPDRFRERQAAAGKAN